ncbi:penicillin acylase family protein [Kribbella sp. NPDC051770]|uniref:penicillin acylase family protein n=1 Tax=Kribbella sp. NPDC051770 TaxID=3155413 RepID=UPI00342D2FEC
MKVYRDSWGVPHLRADDTLSLVRLQGRNVAADRAWQIEMQRRKFSGTTAAVLGPDAVAWDTFARQARIADTAERCFEALDDDTRAWVEAYVAGVNEGLPGGAARAPEFVRTGVSPQEWEPWAPLGIWIAIHILFAGFPDKLWREEVSRRLGDGMMQVFTSEGPRSSGSNGWMIPGALTATGTALIAGDPHRYVESPGIYQQIRLACPEYDVLGLAVPGIPGIAHFGHAGEVAWAITNAAADYQDLYEEQLRRTADGVEALGPDGWEAAAVHTESVQVAGRDAIEVEVIETARGPVVIDQRVSLRYPPRVTGRLGFEVLPRLLGATNVAAVDAALDGWVEPVNVVLAADTAGGLLHRTAGLVPLRDAENLLRVVPAWESKHRWTGWFDPMPRATVDGVAVMANSRHLAEPLGLEFSAPHRYRRIQELLTARDGWSVEEMPTIHTDTWLGSAGSIIDPLAALQDLSPAAGLIRARLQAWDRRMDAASTTASTYAAIRKALSRRITAHPAIAALDEVEATEMFLPYLDLLTHVSFALENLLASDLPIDFSALLRESLEEVAAQKPRGPWGDTHQLAPLQVLRGPLFERHEEPVDLGLSGDHHCVWSTSSIPGSGDLSVRASAARYAWDLSDRTKSGWSVPLGASGVLGDEHHHDQLPLWLAGELAPIVTDWDQLTPE